MRKRESERKRVRGRVRQMEIISAVRMKRRKSVFGFIDAKMIKMTRLLIIPQREREREREREDSYM